MIGSVLAGLALLVSFGIDFGNTKEGGAIDLRNRITGVRLLEAEIDPYHYKWHYGDPDTYCDVYNNPNLPVSKTTVTPPLLLLHAPYAAAPYRLGQFLWFFTQWVVLLGTGRDLAARLSEGMATLACGRFRGRIHLHERVAPARRAWGNPTWFSLSFFPRGSPARWIANGGIVSLRDLSRDCLSRCGRLFCCWAFFWECIGAASFLARRSD